MTVLDVYEWLFENVPTRENLHLRLIWSNMASYCYFINSIDFGNMYRVELNKLFEISHSIGIQIPDQNHAEVLRIAEQLQTSNTISELKQLLHG